MALDINRENDFAAWIADAQRGETYCYAEGICNLAHDGRFERVSVLAWRYSDQGLVNLVQRRTSPDKGDGKGGTFDYLAQRTRKRA